MIITNPASTVVVHQTGSLDVTGSIPGLGLNFTPGMGVFSQRRQHLHSKMRILGQKRQGHNKHKRQRHAGSISTKTLTARVQHGGAEEMANDG